jgi:hypothetical protein
LPDMVSMFSSRLFIGLSIHLCPLG